MRHLRLSRCSYYTESIAKLDVPCHYSRLKFVLCLHVNFRCTTLPFDNETIFIFRVFHSFIALKTTDGMKVPSSTSKIQEEVYIASVPKNTLSLTTKILPPACILYCHKFPFDQIRSRGMNSVSAIGE